MTPPLVLISLIRVTDLTYYHLNGMNYDHVLYVMQDLLDLFMKSDAYSHNNISYGIQFIVFYSVYS